MSYAAITEYMDSKERSSFDLKLTAPPQTASGRPAREARPSPQGEGAQQLMRIMQTVPQKGAPKVEKE